MIGIRDEREGGLEPEPHTPGPQDLVSEALVCALGLHARFSPTPAVRRLPPPQPGLIPLLVGTPWVHVLKLELCPDPVQQGRASS